MSCGFNFCDGLALNHLKFADDMLILCDDDASQLSRMSTALEAFLWASGLKINLDKTFLIGVNVPQSRVEELATIFDVSVGGLPFVYLGVPLGDNSRKRQF